MTGAVVLRARTTLVAVFRRRLTLGVLVVMPIAFYALTHEASGRAVRSLAFGLSWSVSTVAFFAAISARQLEPRLLLCGWRRSQLLIGRLLGLAAVGGGLAALFGLLVAVDLDVRSVGGVFLDYVVTATVAVALGTAIGSVVRRELEGTLILFLLAGLQALADPFQGYTRALPFWSSRELGTWAVDGPAVGSLADGLVHAAVVVAICALVLTVTAPRPRRRRPGP